MDRMLGKIINWLDWVSDRLAACIVSESGESEIDGYAPEEIR